MLRIVLSSCCSLAVRMLNLVSIDPAGDVDALQIFGQLREQPALIVGERLIGQSLEEHRAGHDRAVQIIGRFIETGLRVVAAEGPVERVEIFPHLGGDVFADAAGVFAGAGEAGEDAVGVVGARRSECWATRWPIAPSASGNCREPQDRQEALPLLGLQGGSEIADVDQDVGVDQQHTCDVFGAALRSGPSSTWSRRRGRAWAARV